MNNEKAATVSVLNYFLSSNYDFSLRNKWKIEQHPSGHRAYGFFHPAKYCTIHSLNHVLYMQRDISAHLTD